MEGEQNKPPAMFGCMMERNGQVLRRERCEYFTGGAFEAETSDECKPLSSTKRKSAAAFRQVNDRHLTVVSTRELYVSVWIYRYQILPSCTGCT
jgi:hypothetical protein